MKSFICSDCLDYLLSLKSDEHESIINWIDDMKRIYPISAKNNEDMTALMIAEKYGQLEACKDLINAG